LRGFYSPPQEPQTFVVDQNNFLSQKRKIWSIGIGIFNPGALPDQIAY